MRFLRFGICALVVFAVAAHGGVEEWSQAVFETGASLLFLAWSIWIFFNREEQPVLSPLLPPLAVLSFIVLGQWFFRWTASPYNTRIFSGLPPGPVGNPGESSIDAALNPAQSDYLYYVREPSRDDGAPQPTPYRGLHLWITVT